MRNEGKRKGRWPRWFLYAGLWAAPSPLALAQMEHGGMRPWSGPAEAGWLYWLIVIAVLAALLGFAAWTLYGRHGAEKTSTRHYHALGSLVVLMTLFTLVLYLIVAFRAQSTPPTDRAWDWRYGELLHDPGGTDLAGEPYRGYQVYLSQGCVYCHTLYLRPEDVRTGWGEGATEEDVSQSGDFVNFPFALLGTQRDGPDLTIIGKKIPDMSYQIEHLKDPRRFKPDSVMPTYDYLSDRDLNDLAAFLVSLGNPPEALKSGEVGAQPAGPGGEVDPLVQQGQGLYRSLGCLSCHSVDGSPNVGPTWQGLFGKTETLADGSQVEADADYLIEAIVEPGASVVQGYPNVMPAYPQLTQEELDALVAYIESLGGNP